jgi:hypothetical protein
VNGQTVGTIAETTVTVTGSHGDTSTETVDKAYAVS